MLITKNYLTKLGFSWSQDSYWFNYQIEVVPDSVGFVVVLYNDDSKIVKVSDSIKYMHELEKYLDENEVQSKPDFSKFYSETYGLVVSGCLDRMTKEIKCISSQVRSRAKDLFGPTISKEFIVKVFTDPMELRVIFRHESISIKRFFEFDRTSGFEYYVDSFTESELKRLNKR